MELTITTSSAIKQKNLLESLSTKSYPTFSILTKA